MILFHAAETDEIVGQYTAALAGFGAEVELRIVTIPGLSSAYDALAERLASRGNVLEELLRYASASGSPGHFDSITLASWSAGYGAVRAILRSPSAYQVDAVVGLDSWHSGFDPDGTASDLQLGGLVSFALRALAGDAVLSIGHTDVETPQTGPARYASTTQVASEVRRLIGFGPAESRRGNVRIEAFDRHVSDRAEHIAALRDWGPGFLADTVRILVERPGGPVIRKTTICKGVGELALELSMSAMRAGVREIPGPKHHPAILEYFAGCRRRGANIGQALQADEHPWCAAAASRQTMRAAVILAGADDVWWNTWLSLGALPKSLDSLVGWSPSPHRWRAAVIELWRDALASGTARSIESVRAGEVEPLPGWLAIQTRGAPAAGSGIGAFQESRGLGHVDRVKTWDGDAGRVVGANVSDGWQERGIRADSDTLVGFVAYPESAADLCPPGDAELSAIDRLIAEHLQDVTRRVWAGEGFDPDIVSILAKVGSGIL